MTPGQADRYYRRYGPVVYRGCLRLLGDKDAARDATQTIFISLLADVKRLLGPQTALLDWIAQMVTEHCECLRARSQPLDARKLTELVPVVGVALATGDPE